MPYRRSPLQLPGPPRRARRWVPVVALAAAGAVGAWAKRRLAEPPRTQVTAASTSTECANVLVAGELGRTHWVACGAVRMALTPNAPPTVAAERFAADIVGAMLVADGWVFVTEDGVVARSDTFLGRARALGRFPCAIRHHAGDVLPASSGRLVLIDPSGALWTTDGRAALARVTLPSRVRAAAFASVARGAVVLDDGGLLATANGGASWSAVDLGPEVATGVVFDGADALYVNTTAGTRALVDGALRPELRCGLTADPLSAERGADELDRVRAAAARVTAVFQAPPASARCPASAGSARSSEALWEMFPEAAAAPAYRCHVARPTRGATSLRERLPASMREQVVDVAFPASSGRAVAAVRRLSDDTLRLVVAWSGADRDGAFAGVAGPRVTGAAAPDFGHASERPPDGEILIEAVTRRGVLLSGEDLGHVLLWGAPGRDFVSLGAPASQCLEPRGDHRIVAALPDGGIGLIYASPGGDYDPVVAVELTAEGRLARRRAILAGPWVPPVLARWNDELGIVLWTREPASAGSFHPLRGGEARLLPPAPARPPDACDRAPAPGAITLWFECLSRSFLPTTDEDRELESEEFGSTGSTEVEWTSEGMCVRSFFLGKGGWGIERAGGVPMTMHARPGNRYEGSLHDDGEQRVTCRIDNRPHPAGDE